MNFFLTAMWVASFCSASARAVDADELGQSALSSQAAERYQDTVARAVIRPALHECLPRTAKPQPGIITITMKISGNGVASNVQVTPKSPANRCIEKRIRNSQFPSPPKPPESETLFSYSTRINIH